MANFILSGRVLGKCEYETKFVMMENYEFIHMVYYILLNYQVYKIANKVQTIRLIYAIAWCLSIRMFICEKQLKISRVYIETP